MAATGSATHPAYTPSAGCDSSMAAFVSMLVAMVNARLEAEHRQQAEEAEQQAQRFDDEYDFVVVGGGTAGCVLAERLSRQRNVSVLLLERGGTEPQQARVPGYLPYILQANTAEYLTAVPEPQSCAGAGCSLPAAFVLGGASAIGGMIDVRGSPVDFDEWADLTGDPSWNYTSLLPYFKRAERNRDRSIARDTEHHGREGPQPVQWQRYRHRTTYLLRRALRSAGLPFRLDVNAGDMTGHTVAQGTGECGERWSTYRSYLLPALDRPNLRVLTYATATRVLFEQQEHADGDARPGASAVMYRNAAGQLRAVRALREVVVSAGALRTPHLLMLSGIGPAEQLQELNITLVADLPVGRGLQDHVRPSGIELTCEPPLCDADWGRRARDLQDYARLRAGPLTATGPLHLTAFANTNGWEDPLRPDLQMLFQGALEVNGSRCLHNEAWRFNRIKMLPTALRPLSRGSVRLDPSDPEGAPVVRMGYLTDPGGRDLNTTLQGLRLALRLAGELGETGLRLNRDPKLAPACSDLIFGSDEHLRCVARTTTVTLWHWSGTCRMGRDDDDQAVLDSRMRVRGVARLRVADASAMPTVTRGAPLATVIALAERAADIILQDNGLPPR